MLLRGAALAILFSVILLAEKNAIRPPSGPKSGPYSAGVTTDRFLYVSGHVGPEPDGKFAPFDIKTQTRRCLEKVGRVLKEAGLSYDHVVSTTLYLTDIRTLPAADEAYREVFQGRFPARVVIESQLLIPEALAEVSAVAIRTDPQSAKKLQPAGWKEPAGPYSHGVAASGALFLSTLTPVDPATDQLIGDTIEAQTAQVLRNQQALLAAAGMKPSELAASRVYLTDPRYTAPFLAAHRKQAGGSPALALVHGTPLSPGHLLSMQSVADAHAKTNMYYLEAAGGRSAKGGYARNDIQEQTRAALRTIEQKLAARGMTFADCVDAVVWLRDPRHAAAMNDVYREIVKPNAPARATVRLAPPDAEGLIQIVMLAHK